MRRKRIKTAKLTPSNKVILKFTGKKPEFNKILKKIKEDIPPKDRRFIASSGQWEISYDEEYMEILHDLNFDIDPDLYRKWKGSFVDEGWKEEKIPKRYKFLFDYQQDAMKYSIYHDNRVLLALGVGLGKTPTSLSIADNADMFPLLIVCLSILKTQWVREYYKFIGEYDKIKIIESAKDLKDYDDQYDVYIVNYELLARSMDKLTKDVIPSQKMKEFKRNTFGTVIIDEIHKIKNPESKSSNALKYLCDGVPNIIGLTGTPMTKSSADLYPILNILHPKVFNNQYSFLNRYCKVRVIKGIRQYYGSRNEQELHDLLKNYGMFRLTKEDIGKGGQNKPLQTIIPIPLDSTKEYAKLVEKLEESEDKAGFAIMNEMRVEAWKQKKKSVFEYLDNLLEETDEKIVVFAVNKKVIDDLMEKYGKMAVKIDGSVSTKGDTRDKILQKFLKTKKLRIFIGSIGATSTGLDSLQYASSIGVFLQWPWTPAEITQAIGRIDRTGQTKLVNIYHLVGEGTIEEIFMRILDKKSKMFKEIVDGKELLEDEMLELMLEEAKNNGK